MGFSNFFSDLIYLEDSILKNKVTLSEVDTVKDYSIESVSTFFALRNYVLSCAWTTSNSMEFIVKNMRLNSAELAEKYEAETGRQKAEVTFRVQRASASKSLYSIFGTEFSEALITDNKHEISKLRDYITLLAEGSKDITALFNSHILERFLNLPEIKYTYSIEECSKELMVLSKFTTEYFETQLSELDLDKVKYIYNILSSSFVLGTDNKSFNKNKANMLSQIKKYSRVQSSNKGREQDGVSNNVSKLVSRITILEKENEQKDSLIRKMKANFNSDVDRRVEQRLQEEWLKQQEEKEIDLFDNVEFTIS